MNAHALQFAMNAKKITNKAVINEVLSDEAMLKRCQKEISELRRKLDFVSDIEYQRYAL